MSLLSRPLANLFRRTRDSLTHRSITNIVCGLFTLFLLIACLVCFILWIQTKREVENTRMSVEVFTDGSYSSSRPDGCGIGVHFPKGDFKDISEAFTDRPTNQRAELMAIMRAIQQVRKTDADIKIEIYTDSKYAIGALTMWIHNWRKNGWKTAQSKQNEWESEDVRNRDIIEPLSLLLEGVTFHHVHAHTNQTDAVSKANAVADQLAKAAVKQFKTKKEKTLDKLKF